MMMKGRRLPDTRITEFPIPNEELKPGDYWLVRDYDNTRLLNVKDHPEDRAFWGSKDDPRYNQNLTGLVMSCLDPLGHYGTLSIHTVRLEEDETVSVRPGDGSSNSIMIKRRDDEPSWHGYIEHGEWREC